MTQPPELQVIRGALTARDQAEQNLARAVRALEEADLMLGAAFLVAYNDRVGNAQDIATWAGWPGEPGRQKVWQLMKAAAAAEGVEVRRRRSR